MIDRFDDLLFRVILATVSGSLFLARVYYAQLAGKRRDNRPVKRGLGMLSLIIWAAGLTAMTASVLYMLEPTGFRLR